MTAEFSIALALSDKMKAINMSPFKALSNHKYFDFRKIFPRVCLAAGLIFIKSPHNSQATYAMFLWKQHWRALFRDKLVIHRYQNHLSTLAQTIPIPSITKVVFDTLDASFITFSLFDWMHTQRYAIRNPHRAT